MPKRMWITSVVAPAPAPATQAMAVASAGCTPATSSVAATAAPSVMEPSAVMSGKSNTEAHEHAEREEREDWQENALSHHVLRCFRGSARSRPSRR